MASASFSTMSFLFLYFSAAISLSHPSSAKQSGPASGRFIPWTPIPAPSPAEPMPFPTSISTEEVTVSRSPSRETMQFREDCTTPPAPGPVPGPVPGPASSTAETMQFIEESTTPPAPGPGPSSSIAETLQFSEDSNTPREGTVPAPEPSSSSRKIIF